MSIKSIVILLLHLSMFLQTSESKDVVCKTDKDCDDYYCAYCYDRNKCKVIDADIFNPQLPCKYNTHHCYKGYDKFCNQHIDVKDKVFAFDGYGACICYCGKVQMYGKYCQYPLPYTYSNYTRPASGIQFASPIHIKFLRTLQALVIIAVGNDPIILMQDTFGGFIARQEKPTWVHHQWNKERCFQFLESRYYYGEWFLCHSLNYEYVATVYIVDVTIPFDLSTPPGKNVASFTRTLRMDAYDRYFPEMKLTTQSFDYHIFYPEPKDMEQYVVARFTNCGPTLESIATYKLKDRIHLEVQFYKVDGNKFTLIPMSHLDLDTYHELRWYEWKRFKLEGNTNDNPWLVDYKVNKPYWDIKPFKWLGVFYVNFTIQARIHTNFNLCFFKVELSPLVAEIRGGSSRSVFREYGLILDATNSRNPNVLGERAGMYFVFSCNWTREDVCKPFTVVNSLSFAPYIIPKDTLQSDRVYNFTLKVSSNMYTDMQPAYASQIVVVKKLGDAEDYLEHFTVECVYNCQIKTNVKDLTYLRVGGNWTRLDEVFIAWEQFAVDKEGARHKTSVEHVRQNDTSSFILIIQENILAENQVYEFIASYKNYSQFAAYRITTSSPASLTCELDPVSGEAGLTNFKLSCTPSYQSKHFEFYDKHEEEESEFSGRMITAQESSQLDRFILTRGKLEVFSFDDYGIASMFTLNVKLSRSSRTIDDIKHVLASLIEQASYQTVDDSLETASVISDLLTSALETNETNGPEMWETLVEFLSTLPIKRYVDAKVGVSTLHITLLAARGSLSLNGALHAVRTIQTIAHALAVGLKSGHQCTFEVLYQIFSRLLDCLYIVMEVEERYIGNETEALRYLDPVDYERAKEISRHIVKSSFLLKTALSFRHLPAQTGKLIESSLGNLSIWTKVDVPKALSKYTQEQHRKKMFPVIVPDDLAEEAKEMGVYLALQFVSFKRDPTWLGKTNTQRTLDVSVCYKENNNQNCLYPLRLKYGIRVVFDISDVVLQIKFTNLTINRLDPHLDPDVLDEKLPVYKIDPLPMAEVDVVFRFDKSNTGLIVTAKKEKRPTFAMLVKDKYEINSTSKQKVYQVVTDASNRHLYYLAIQPESTVKVNETATFEIKIYSKLCYTWHDRWETGGCEAYSDPVTGALVCECRRLSLIGGLVKEIFFSLDTADDFTLSLTISTFNVPKVLSIPLLLLTFFLLALICFKADRHDKSKRFVSILPDNLPGNKFGYLVRVVTGARLGAGTDAAVGIKLYGTLNDACTHILSCATHDVMEGMGEDWFLFNETENLGKIVCLDLWHDNSGAKPHWFCDSVTIFDLHHKDCYFFLVNDWIALSSKRFPEICSYPVPFSEITSPTRVFLDYFKSGFHLSHLWLATVTRHPRDPVSRTDRLAIILCFILVSMAISISFITMLDDAIEIDDFAYSVTWTMIGMSICTCILAAVVTCLLMHLFRRIYTVIFYIEREGDKSKFKKVSRVSIHEDFIATPSITTLSGDKNHIHYGRRHKASHEVRTEKNDLALSINLALMPKPLAPVQIDGDNPNVIIKIPWLFLTWVVVIIIVIYCIIVSMILSKNLPPLKTLEWFTIVGFSVFVHAFILLPLKITLVSAILAVAFKRIIYKDVYTFEPDDGRQFENFGQLPYLVKLVYLRSLPMYQPVHEVFREEHRQKMMRARRWRMLSELVVQVIFLVVLIMLLGGQIPTQYQTNSHLRSLMRDLHKVHNTTDLHYFLHQCESYLFRDVWYNWKVFSQRSEQKYFRKDWMYDGVSRMVGGIRSRQFRVKPGYCKASVNLPIDCAAPFSGAAEDTRDYLPYWIGDDDNVNREKLNETGINLLNKWSYHWPCEESDFVYDGATGQAYSSGGYIWDLGSSDGEMDASLARLWERRWIDHYTRAVLTQVNVYNVNNRMFSRIALVSEQTIAGQILPTVVIHSVDIDVQLDWWLAMFVFFALMLCVRVFVMVNFVGVCGLFDNRRRPFELLMAVNAFLVLPFLVLHHLKVPQYVSEYQLHAEELEYFDFYKIACCKNTARTLLCVLLILNFLRFFSLWRFGKRVFRMFMAVALSVDSVIWLVLIFVVAQVVVFRCVGYLFFAFIDVVFNPNMFYRYNYYNFPANTLIGCNMLCFIMSFNSVVFIMLFVSIFVRQYRSRREAFAKHWSVANYFKFVHTEIKTLLGKPRVRRTTRIFKTLLGWQENRV